MAVDRGLALILFIVAGWCVNAFWYQYWRFGSRFDRVVVGMEKREVRSILGRPDTIEIGPVRGMWGQELWNGDSREEWRYDLCPLALICDYTAGFSERYSIYFGPVKDRNADERRVLSKGRVSSKWVY